MPRLIQGGTVGRALLAAMLLCAAFAAMAAHAPNANAARGLDLGFYDGEFGSGDPATQTSAFDHAVQAHAGWALIYVGWSAVAPATKPNGFNPRNPADPRYNWDATDAAVRDANARGLKVLLSVTRAPAFAEGPGRPSESDAPPGTWKPNPADLADFTDAIAKRYDGHFMNLPAVRYWQL